MRYEIEGERVTYYMDNPRRETEKFRRASFEGTTLTAQQITPILDASLRKYRGLSFGRQQHLVTLQLKPLFAWFRTSGNSWPVTSNDWNVFMVRFFQFYLTDHSYSQAQTKTRARCWLTSVNPWLVNLQDEDVIPLDVRIPTINSKKVRSLAKDRSFLGQRGKRLLSTNEQPKKLLVDISFGKSDEDYLDSVERQCRHLIDVVKEVCLTHWTDLMKDAETGKQLAAEVTDAQIDDAIAQGRYVEARRVGSTNITQEIKLASPKRPQGISWALAVVRHTLRGSEVADCVSIDVLRRSPFFNASLFKGSETRLATLDSVTEMSPEQWQHLSSTAQFYRFAGFLSPLDVAAACALLTIEHPNFNAESLQNAVLLNVRGKLRLLLTDSKNEPIFCVDKPRAGKLKWAVLSELAYRIVLDIVRATAPARNVLKRAGDKGWRYLFLGVSSPELMPGILGAVEATTRFLNGTGSTLSLTRLYPTLEQNGLTKGSLDYRRIRNTMGIIKWFESGSILEMSRTLGNTRKVALEHYLPPALLHAWNTRIIRRFQNTLIVLAAHDEPYLLDVTDFTNMADLTHFIGQLILAYPAKTSPLADEVQRRLGSATETIPGLLHIRLSPKSIAYLYSYSDLAKKALSDDELNKVDTLSGLAPRQFIDMATLLKHAAESETIHDALRGSLDVTRLVECHGQALVLQKDLDARFAKLVVKHEWAEAE